ncbi:amino acid adenylation domain-containing protein [Paenibacillus sp. FSL R7-0331]
MTYQELDERSLQVARALINSGVRPNEIVGIKLNRDPRIIVAMLGVLRAGGAFLPLDLGLPLLRSKFMMENSKLPYLLTDDLDGEVPEYTRVISMGEIEKSCYPKENILGITPEQLAYVIYTSGSTGVPKGVMIQHQSLIHFIQGIQQAIDLHSIKQYLCLAPMSFDIFMVESLLPLSLGKTIILAQENHRKNPLRLAKLLIEKNVELVQMTPTAMSMFLSIQRSRSALRNVKIMMIGGEPFPRRLLEQLLQLTGSAIYNVYGPTEGTVWAAAGRLYGDREIHLGSFLNYSEPLLLDALMTPVNTGEIGELFISGMGLALGYVNNDEETDKRFIEYHDGACKKRVYRTGDLLTRRKDGTFVFVGRADNQIKIKGHRIEPEEIEKMLLLHPDVTGALVFKAGEEEETFLSAWYCSPTSISIAEWTSFLSSRLSEYMIPSIFKQVDRLPLNNNGKLDRKACMAERHK